MTGRTGWLRRLTACTTAGGLLLLTAPVLTTYAGAPDANDQRLVSQQVAHSKAQQHPRRKLVRYTVRPGDTATGLAVRFHAWTDELLERNHLTAHSTLYVGQHLVIPVVRRHHRQHAKSERPRDHHRRHRDRDPSRAVVRRAIIRSAHRHRVKPTLALAISWQESGWQMDQVSSANAIGAMQVIPPTGRWMSQVVGRRLHLHRLHDNVTAGVVLIRVLRNQTTRRRTIAGYYQGLASVHKYGMYSTTKRYVANVLALEHALDDGWNPA